MNIIRKQFRIGGMTCVNCQNKIEKTLRHTAGVKEISVSYSTGMAQVAFDPDVISFRDIAAVIEELDYEVLKDTQAEAFDISRTVSLLVIIIGLYVLLQQLGVLNLLVPSRLADSTMGYGMLFVVGLLTSVHCIAMCGGISLSQCIPKAEAKSERGWFSTYRPSVLYNMGRVISYTVIGFILGFIGMLIGGSSGTGISVMVQGLLKLIAGAVMVIMGLNMLGIFPWLRHFSLRMPGVPAVRLGKRKLKSRQPLFVGLLNGLMPCGPLQSMQIIALASANPVTGALSMLLFSLGTVPLMLGLGSIVSALGKRFARTVMSVGAVLVAVLGLAMLSQGGSLSGLLLSDKLLFGVIALSVIGVAASVPFPQNGYRAVSVAAALAVVILGGMMLHCHTSASSQGDSAGEAADIQIVDGVQLVNSTLYPGSYPDITVQAGIPVKWVINAPDGSINGCNYKMIIRSYGIEYSFQEGENVIEFTPTETGNVSYTCWMGMIHGNINVVQGTDIDAAGDASEDADGYEYSGLYDPLDTGSSCCGSGTGGSSYTSGAEDSCCGSGTGNASYIPGWGGSCCGD